MAQLQITDKTYSVRDFVQSQSRQLGDSLKKGKSSSIKSKLSKIDDDEEDDDIGKNLKKV